MMAFTLWRVLRRNLTTVLARRLLEMDERFREVSTEKVGPRLSSQLVRLSDQVGNRVNGHVEIGLSRGSHYVKSPYHSSTGL